MQSHHNHSEWINLVFQRSGRWWRTDLWLFTPPLLPLMDCLLLIDFFRVLGEFSKPGPKEKETFFVIILTTQEMYFSWFPISSKSSFLGARTEQAVLMRMFLITLLRGNNICKETTFQWVCLFIRPDSKFLGKLLTLAQNFLLLKNANDRLKICYFLSLLMLPLQRATSKMLICQSCLIKE